MTRESGMIAFLLFFLSAGYSSFSAPKGKQTGVSFNQALPEDISNENFPDRVDGFDFPNASLLDLVKAIGRLTGINFIVDTGLRDKKISIIAPSPITVAEAYKAFLSALAANGYTVVKAGAFWKILDIEKAHQDNLEIYSGDYFPNTDQLITRIIRLKYINAENFEKSIKTFLSKKNKFSVDEHSNSIIISDYGSVIEKVMKLIDELDTPGSEEGIQIIPVEHASAEELAKILSDLLSVKSGSSRSSYTPRSSRRKSGQININLSSGSSAGNLKISHIISDERTNSLIISANPAGVERVRNLIKKLDTPIDASRLGGVYVYNVLYGTAEEVYNTLMGIKPSKAKTNERAGAGRQFPFSYRGGRAGAGKSAQSPLFGNVTILADSNTNSLIISAKNKYDYERVEAVLKKIDVPRDQVFIQAIIVEMRVDDDNEKNLNLAGAVGALFTRFLNGENTNNTNKKSFFQEVLGSSVGGFLNQSFDIKSLTEVKLGPGLILGAPFSSLLSKLSEINLAKDLVSTIDQSPTFKPTTENERQNMLDKITRVSNDSLNNSAKTAYFPLIQLLKKTTDINILSTPQLTTLDNVPAFIEVGENAPVGLTSTATAGALAQSSVEREDVTLRLDIVPRINPESGTVQMDIKQKFDDFSNRSSAASELKARGVHIVKRQIETKMVLNDGETAVLGGLLTDKETRNETKVPILGDIPILGWLFKGSNAKIEKRNLLVFITPTIIKGERQKDKTKEIVGKKLEERINFIKKYMKGRDPHGKILQNLIPDSKATLGHKSKTKKWFWQSSPSDKESSVRQKSKDESYTADEPDSETAFPETDGAKEESFKEELDEELESLLEADINNPAETEEEALDISEELDQALPEN